MAVDVLTRSSRPLRGKSTGPTLMTPKLELLRSWEDVCHYTGIFPEEARGSEEPVSRSLTTPLRPTQRMIEDHNVSHIPFRAWCPACVRGRAKSVGHRLQDKSEDLVPVVSVDYGFLGREGDIPIDGVGSNNLPILVAHDRRSRSISGRYGDTLCPARGSNTHTLPNVSCVT